MILLLLLTFLCDSSISFIIARVVDLNSTLYLVSNGVARQIVKISDATFLSDSSHFTKQVDVTADVISAFKQGPYIPAISFPKDDSYTPDDIIRIELIKINALQVPLLYDIRLICEHFH